MMSEWPFKNLVAEVMLMSAPKARGCWKVGAIMLLSTTTRAPACPATKPSEKREQKALAAAVGVTEASAVAAALLACCHADQHGQHQWNHIIATRAAFSWHHLEQLRVAMPHLEKKHLPW